MKEAGEVAALYETVRTAHEQNPAASPAWLATAVMQAIGFPRELHSIAYKGTHQMFEHIAREIAAGKDRDQIVGALIDGIDPSANAANPPIINAKQQADALMRHADALEAWNPEQP